jgi:hypothetical protein
VLVLNDPFGRIPIVVTYLHELNPFNEQAGTDVTRRSPYHFGGVSKLQPGSVYVIDSREIRGIHDKYESRENGDFPSLRNNRGIR